LPATRGRIDHHEKGNQPVDEVDMEYELMLRLVVEKPPAGVDFGLQKGRGREYETIQRQRSTLKDLQFDFTVRARVGRKAGVPDFLGAIVQGSPTERFVYVDIGTYAGQKDALWSRRLKVPLSGITWGLIRTQLRLPARFLKPGS
jgi:uncharacterized protein DUF5990